MALEGTLDDFSLADIFQLIGIQRKTGVLTLKNRDEMVTVTFHNGMVVGADSHPKKLEDRLGKVLVRTGLISREQLAEALDLQKKTLQKIGFILVDQNYISRGELKEALQIQVTQMIYRLFRWNSGEYYFDQKARVDPDSDESISPMSAESILMEGIHMIDEWPVIQKRIRNFDTVFRRTVQIEEVQLEDSESNGEDDDQERIRLSREEESVFRLVDGHSSVAEIIESSKLGEFHTCKALYDLLERKIIEPVFAAPKLSFQAASVARSDRERAIDYRYFYPALVIVVAVAVYLSSSDPFGFFRNPFFAAQDVSTIRAGLNHHRLKIVDSAITMYFFSRGTLPNRLEDLIKAQYLRLTDISDAEGRPLLYDVEGNRYTVSVIGANGHAGLLSITRSLTLSPTTPLAGNGRISTLR